MNLNVGGRAGESLLEALRRTEGGASVSAPCGGRGRCGKCLVRVPAEISGSRVLEPPSAPERALLSASELASGLRLSCLAGFARDGELGIELAEEAFDIPLGAWLSGASGVAGRSRRESGDPSGDRPLRLAVDLGTTTIAACLFDPWTDGGRGYGQAAEANLQRAWGADVVSRIDAAGKGALESMRSSAVGQIGALAERLCARACLPLDALGEIVVAGNTVMLHLLAGCDPSGLGRLPFAPIFLDERVLDAAEAGMPSLAGSRLRLLPGISAFVGADLTAGTLASGILESEEPELLVDLGTNGEIVLSCGSGILCSATAAGPAFEGASIECGSPSVAGAVDHAGWNGDFLWSSTIGSLPPTGICGSGLLDVAAALRRRGLADETGLLEGGEGEAGSRRIYVDPGRRVFVSQADLRQLQLAKGAIAAGIRLVCSEAGLGASDIARVHLAGGFGSRLDPRSALAIGLLPPELAGRIVAEGNTSLKGAMLAAGSEEAREACRKIASSGRAIDLASLPAFQDAFMDSMLFPEDEVLEGLALE